MAGQQETKDKAARVAEIRKRIAARREARKSEKNKLFDKMVAASKSPEKFDGIIRGVSDKLASYAEGIANLRDHLGLKKAAKDAPLRVRVAASRNYGRGFRRIAQESPERLAEALNEAYKGLDEIAAGLEMAADELGISLDMTPAVEEAVEVHEEEEHAVPMEEMAEEAVEEHEEEEHEKESSASGSDPFVTDRDKSGQPKSPVKVEAPMAKGESEVNKGASAPAVSRKPAESFVKDIPQSQGQSEVNKDASKATPAGKKAARGSL